MSNSDLPKLAQRTNTSHKGDYGRALLIGGSPAMAGAISLAGMAALRSGAGLVTLAVPRCVQATVAQFEPSYMCVALAETDDGFLCDEHHLIEQVAKDKTAVACGPGLGRNPQTTKLVHWLYQTIQQPMVLDADSLNALAEQPSLLQQAAGPRILTPHPGEFLRLSGQQTNDDDEQRQQAAEQFAVQNNIVLVLKGHRTVITDGKNTTINTTGNPGMATGGSGDVLTGIITALLCQNLSPYDAARLAAHIHGRAGDLAATAIGQVSMIASDIVEYLPEAFMELN